MFDIATVSHAALYLKWYPWVMHYSSGSSFPFTNRTTENVFPDK